MRMQKIYCGSVPFTAINIYATMTTSPDVKPGNVKMVHKSKKKHVKAPFIYYCKPEY